MQDMFKGNVSMQDTHTQIMSSCKTLQFRKTCLLSLVGRHDLLKDMSSCLKMPFYCFCFLCFTLLKTCLFPRHVLNIGIKTRFLQCTIGGGRYLNYFLMGCVDRGLKPLPISEDFFPPPPKKKTADLTFFPKFWQIRIHF